MILIMQEREGSLRCNECGDFVSEGETAEQHGERVHADGDVYVVHPDDHDPLVGDDHDD